MNSSSNPPAFFRRLPAATAALGVFALLFRSLIWPSWLPYRDEPYGASDILEFLMASVLVFLSATGVVAGITFLLVRTWGYQRLGIRLLAVGVLVPAFYYLLHPRLPLFHLW